jgi:hypothetical protein
MSREIRLDEDIELYLGPVATALFIEFDWIREAPMTITGRGLAVLRSGVGPADMPIWLSGRRPSGKFHETTGSGALWWPGRKIKQPRQITRENRP